MRLLGILILFRIIILAGSVSFVLAQEYASKHTVMADRYPIAV
jgi:hypothetical protein